MGQPHSAGRSQSFSWRRCSKQAPPPLCHSPDIRRADRAGLHRSVARMIAEQSGCSLSAGDPLVERQPPGDRLESGFATHWYQFCICDIISMLRASMHAVRMFTERDFYRGRHGQESEEGKEDREDSHQEGGKEDLKEKEVIVSTTEKLPPPDRNPDAKRNLSKGSEMSFAAIRYRGKAL
jgi:hypothetical protein